MSVHQLGHGGGHADDAAARIDEQTVALTDFEDLLDVADEVEYVHGAFEAHSTRSHKCYRMNGLVYFTLVGRSSSPSTTSTEN